jgi:hypothetical protein
MSLAGYTTTTVFPDPDPETTSCDRRLFEVGLQTDTWATCHDRVSGTSGADSDAYLAVHISTGSGTDGFRYLLRSQIFFDSSAIPDTDTVSAATLSIYGTDKADVGTAINPTCNIFGSTSVATTTIPDSDFSALNATAKCDTAITYANWSTAGYNDFTLNASGLADVSKTGLSRFAWREAAYDAPNSAPTWSAATDHRINGNSADVAGTANDPKLVVTHAAVAAIAASRRIIITT